MPRGLGLELRLQHLFSPIPTDMSIAKSLRKRGVRYLGPVALILLLILLTELPGYLAGGKRFTMDRRTSLIRYYLLVVDVGFYPFNLVLRVCSQVI